MRVRVHGTVVATYLDLDPQRIRARITQLRLSNGVTIKPARDLTLSVPVERTLRRTTASGRPSRSCSGTSSPAASDRLVERLPGDGPLGARRSGAPYRPRPAQAGALGTGERGAQGPCGPLGIVRVPDRADDCDAASRRRRRRRRRSSRRCRRWRTRDACLGRGVRTSSRPTRRPALLRRRGVDRADADVVRLGARQLLLGACVESADREAEAARGLAPAGRPGRRGRSPRRRARRGRGGRSRRAGRRGAASPRAPPPARRAARRSGRCFSRSCTTSTPPADRGLEEVGEVRPRGGDEVEPRLSRRRRGGRRRGGRRSSSPTSA